MSVMVLTRDAVCAHEGCILPGEPHERWGHGFTFCEAHMEYAQQVLARQAPDTPPSPDQPEIVIPPGVRTCPLGHAKVPENLSGRGCRACNNTFTWARSHKITDPVIIQQRADARYLQILGATT